MCAPNFPKYPKLHRDTTSPELVETSRSPSPQSFDDGMEDSDLPSESDSEEVGRPPTPYYMTSSPPPSPGEPALGQSRFGLSSPVSLDLPLHETILSVRLVEALRRFAAFDDEFEPSYRESVLEHLEELLHDFVSEMDPEAEVDFGLSVFGSFAFGAYLAGADMDVLFLAPEKITKQDFFEGCYTMLKNSHGTSSLTVVTHDYAPMFLLNFHGVAIKLVFATVPSSVAIGGFAWDDPTFLASLEDAGLGSLNGPRFSGDLKALVPSLSVFQMALCFVKAWAKRRMIYSSTMGYFGGDAWAVMVAYMCQLYPDATISALVSKFFETFSKWQWPTPVGLKASDGAESPIGFWDVKACDLDPSCSMPIISPSFPYACITNNVTKASKALITYELLRGARLSHKANIGSVEWDALLKEPRFFDLYKQYIRIFVCCEDSSKQQSLIGNVELKIRDFAASLEHAEQIAFAHTNPFRFTSVYYCRSEIDLQQVKNGILEGVLLSLTFIVPTKPVYTTSFYIGIIPNSPQEAVFLPEAEAMFTHFEDELNAEDFFPATSSVKVSLLTCEDIPPNVYTPPSSC